MNVEKNHDLCVMCNKAIDVETLDSTHPEAPTLIRIPAGTWVGVTFNEDSELMRLTCCSEACARMLLAEQAETLLS